MAVPREPASNQRRPRNSKSRINKDPNNTKWLRDETTFGQRIMRSQGWQPGQYLGVQNAPHAELHTAANASYVRVLLKDDFKGLGFNKAKEDEVTGLDVFSDLLSRLNGKSEEAIAGDQAARLAVKTHAYVERKYGPMRFVRGGLLVGDKLKEVTPDEDDTPTTPEDEDDEEEEKKPAKTKKDKKKRKAADLEDEILAALKGEKKRRKEESDSSSKKSKKAKKTDDENDEEEQSEETESKEERRARRKAKKEEKRLKKEKKKARKAEASAEDSSSSDEEDSGTGTSTPGTGASTPRLNRNFSRTKYIASKKLAMLDNKALNQIFMVKT